MKIGMEYAYADALHYRSVSTLLRVGLLNSEGKAEALRLNNDYLFITAPALDSASNSRFLFDDSRRIAMKDHLAQIADYIEANTELLQAQSRPEWSEKEFGNGLQEAIESDESLTGVGNENIKKAARLLAVALQPLASERQLAELEARETLRKYLKTENNIQQD
ncbi:hypothetical protein [Cerasicoccus frondis]|uniref:hypothetical protein n=1 Tax=Cerasicoccus frondis TaxID=490090 RepID=UPI00285275B3|nr:hypothetical protein [Cerasicoccus frondis]